MLVPILFLSANALAQELQIDADSFEGDTGTQVRANKARLRYGERTLKAGLLLYDTEAGWAQASDGVILEDGDNNRLGADLMDFFPQLSRAVASGNVHFESSYGLSLFAEAIRYEIERKAMFIDGPLLAKDIAGRTLKANAVEYFIDDDKMLAKGGVVLRTPDGARVSTEKIDYRPSAEQVIVEGKAEFADGSGFVFSTEDFRYNLASRAGSMSNVELRSDDTQVFVSSSSASSDADSYQLDDVFFTTCNVNDPAWSVKADSIMVDNEQVAHATNVSFHVGETKVFWLPNFSYSLSNERRSGILAPRASYRSGGEYSVEIPIYLNLAPNYDAMLRPRLISKRGLYGFVEGRWLFEQGAGRAEVGFIDDSEAGDFRSHMEIAHSHAVGNVRFELEASGVGDEAYGDDFFDGDKNAKRHYIRNIAATGEYDNWNWTAAVTDFQTVREQDDEVSKPFSSLPSLSAAWNDYLGDNYVQVSGSFDRFKNRDDPANGVRSHGEVNLQRLIFIGGPHSVNLQGGAAGSRYSVRRREVSTGVYAHEDESSSWLAPYASVDVRPQIWTRWQFGERDLRQLFEPRLFIGLVGRENFDEIPVYDSDRAKSSYQDYFSVNQFVGGDRFEDTSFISYGIDSKTWLEDSGKPWMAVRVAQRYRMRDSEVRAKEEPVPLKGISNALAELRLYPNRSNTLLARLEWNPNIDSFEQGNLEFQQISMAGHAYLVRYTLDEEDDRGDVGLSMHRIITPNLQMAAEANYDLDDRQYGKIGAGVRYLSPCKCWSANFFVERELLADDKDNTSFSISIDLEGLGGLSSDNSFDKLVKGLREPL